MVEFDMLKIKFKDGSSAVYYGNSIDEVELNSHETHINQQNIKNKYQSDKAISVNPLSRHIAFWCKHTNDRMLLENLFIKNIPEDAVCKVRNTKDYVEIVFKDGSIYTFLPFYESARGRRFHEAYVYLDDTTTKDDIDFVNQVIEPIIRMRHSNVYVIDTVEIEKLCRELTMDRKTFEEWYIERIADAYNEVPENSFPIKYEELEKIIENNLDKGDINALRKV